VINTPFLAFILLIAMILYAMHKKGRVKARFRFLGTAFSLEVHDKQGELAKGRVNTLTGPNYSMRRRRRLGVATLVQNSAAHNIKASRR
jgi:hypothetical protein